MNSNFGKCTRLTILAIVLASAIIASCTNDSSKTSCTVTPAFFCAEFAKMQQEIPVRDQDAVKSTSEKDLGKFHLTLGMAIRNEVGLWQDNETTQFFKSHGAEHPDMMSYIMLIALSRYLKGENVNMEDVTHHVVVDLQPPPPPPPPPPLVK